jgi:hypothetical protein
MAAAPSVRSAVAGHLRAINAHSPKLSGMTLFFRALILGYAIAVIAAAWLHASGVALWVVCCIAWIGGNVLGLVLTALGAAVRPAAPEGGEAAIKAELRAWEACLSPKHVGCEPRPGSTRSADGAVRERLPAGHGLVAADAGRRRSR